MPACAGLDCCRSARRAPGDRTRRILARAQPDRPAAPSLPLLLASAVTLTQIPPALAADAASAAAPVDNGWLNPIVHGLDFVLGNIEAVYLSLGVPHAYGWSIISLTAFVKLLTWPLTKQQVESAMAVQNLKPRIDVIKERYGDDKDKVQKETSRLYEAAQVNPLAGCLPSLLQLPIFIGLYRSLNNVAMSGTLDNEGFYWLPSLAGPVNAGARAAGTGTAWLFPLVDNTPPIGWAAAAPYLVLPVLLVLAQYASSAIISPVDPNTEDAGQAATQKAIIYILPLTIGYFSLTVPAGLSLYYFSNSIFTSAQQIYFRKLGGATVATPDLGPVKKLGMGRRMGPTQAPPRAAAALPEFGADLGAAGGSLAAEFGGPMPADGGASSSSALQAEAAGTNGNNTDGTGATGAGAEAAAADDEIYGGLAVSAEEMVGVAAEELEYLSRRCKRTRRPAVAQGGA